MNAILNRNPNQSTDTVPTVSHGTTPGFAASISEIGYLPRPSDDMTERFLKRRKILKTIKSQFCKNNTLHNPWIFSLNYDPPAITRCWRKVWPQQNQIVTDPEMDGQYTKLYLSCT